MSKQDEAKQTIDAAGAASSKVQASWHLAYRAMNGGVSTNAYGIYHDPQEVRGRLLDAKAHIDAALSVIASTKWPSNADYDLAN